MRPSISAIHAVVKHIDQRRFDNQPADYIDAAAASALLGVKRATLYAYVSRGLVSTVDGGKAGPKRYRRTDLDRLRARHDARSGHGPVAAVALRWGEPVLESALTSFSPAGPAYRGHDALALARRRIPFESVAELLWHDAPVSRVRPVWPAPLPLTKIQQAISGVRVDHPSPLFVLAAVTPLLALDDPQRFAVTPAAEEERARRLLMTLAAALGLSFRRRAAPPFSVAAIAARALGAPSPKAVRAIEKLLIVSADHELNASTFATRIAASAGADLYACLSAALATLTGPRHGGACDRVEALLDEVGQPHRATEVIRARQQRGDDIPGFYAHPLYPPPAGDPRATMLLALARTLGNNPATRVIRAILAAMSARAEPPSMELGVVAVTQALALPRGSAAALFALGRAAGWVAHVLEQRSQNFLLRPRARYVGRERITP
jgi:citrate synthase